MLNTNNLLLLTCIFKLCSLRMIFLHSRSLNDEAISFSTYDTRHNDTRQTSLSTTLCCVPFMLRIAFKLIKLSVVTLNVIIPSVVATPFHFVFPGAREKLNEIGFAEWRRANVVAFCWNKRLLKISSHFLLFLNIYQALIIKLVRAT